MGQFGRRLEFFKTSDDPADDRTVTARSSTALWASVCVAIPAAQLLADRVVPGTYERPVVLFWVVVIAATQCVALAVAMLVHSVRGARAETALLGGFVFSVSLLPLAHGLLIPGVLYGPNPAAMVTVQLPVLVGALALLPLAGGRTGVANRVAGRWRSIVAAHVGLTIMLFALFLLDPHVLPAAATGSREAVVIAVGSLLVCLTISYRHLRLAVIARQPAIMGVAIGLVFVGSAPLVFVAGRPWGAGFWLAHLLDIAGVTSVSVFALHGYRRSRTMSLLLGPIDVATPLEAVEIGLDPLVHKWVAVLDAKDEQTRDHVVRTAQLAVLVATEMGLSPSRIRLTGVGAILHDVGKLDIPSEILTKPGRLTDDERAIMETHARTGADRLAASPVLADAAPIVAGHHERVDGRGYPNGLAGDAILIEARIIAACDAYDAITNTRHYRRKRSHEQAEAILLEHAGSQWDADVVEALLRVVRRLAGGGDPAFETVGRNKPFEPTESPWVCHDAVPELADA